MDTGYLPHGEAASGELESGGSARKNYCEPDSKGTYTPFPVGLTRGRRAVGAAVIISCFILCGISLCLHITAAANAVEYLKDGWQNRLVSVILPNLEFSKSSSKDGGEDIIQSEKADSGENESASGTEYNFINEDLSSRAQGGISISNETDYAPDLEALLAASPALPVMAGSAGNTGDPAVLIYHTHGTEAYADTADNAFRSRDTEKNTVAVGKVIADVLEHEGIGVIHLTEMFDEESWSGAYDKSTLAVRSVLSENPTVKYIFDVHRDCIGNAESGYIRSVTTIDGKDAAQLMIVCGTDSGGSSHVTWRDNLSFALRLQSKLWTENSTLMRPIDLRCASFYQDTSPCALLMEFGTCANSLTEAKRSAVMFACVLAGYITDGKCSPDYGEMASLYCN